VSKIRPKQKLFPRWEMPSDPIKAVWWFMLWLLKVLVRFLWLPIIVLVIYEVVVNARIGNMGDALLYGLFTLVIGLAIWVVLYIILKIVNLWIKLAQAIADANQAQQSMFHTFSYPHMYNDRNGKIVEGSISEIRNEEQKQ
jgi:hypothetical protein